MEPDALHQLGMVCRMQFLIRLLAWGICHAAHHTCLAVEVCLRSSLLLDTGIGAPIKRTYNDQTNHQ